MKKRTEKLIAGVLAACILAGTPVNLCAAVAVSPTQKGVAKTQETEDDGLCFETEIQYDIGTVHEEESEYETEWECASEPGYEEESMCEEESECETECHSTEESSTAGSGGYIQLSVEEVPLSDESSIVSNDESATAKETDVKMGIPEIAVELTDHGILDYRTCFAGDVKPTMHIDIQDNFGAKQRTSGKRLETGDSKYKDVECIIQIKNRNVICIEEASTNEIRSKKTDKIQKYSTKERDIAFLVSGVGETKIEISAADNAYGIKSTVSKICVEDSPLYDEDFYMEVRRSDPKSQKSSHNQETVTKYSYGEWMKYLEEHDYWVNGQIAPRLSDEGKKYYLEMKMEKEEEPDPSLKPLGYHQKNYVLWAEHPDRNASTKSVENGTRMFTAGIDTQAPAIWELTTSSQCYEPTRTETEQYYAEDFVLTGNVADLRSGVEKIEYTTNFEAGERAEWSQISEKNGTFSITLTDGCYDAIAVRAYDNAGNVSTISKYVNDNGEPIRVIVDRSEPSLQITAEAGNEGYDGKDDSWTNQNVVYHVASDGESCPYAGIYQCGYMYETIGASVSRAIMTDVSEAPGKWTAIPLDKDSDGRLEIADDRNGYFYFCAVSKSGVWAKEAVKCRILTQHQAADIKPIVVNGVDEEKRKNDWYNKASGVPVIRFEYPNYDRGVTSGEYDAPVTIHYTLAAQTEDGSTEQIIEDNEKNNAVMGVMSSENMEINDEGKKSFVLTMDDLDRHSITFGYDQKTGYAKDGIYTLEYWVTDKAGNRSEKQTSVYKIDSHEPTALQVVVADNEMAVDSEASIVYERFYKEAAAGNASAQYGISGEGTIKILRAKKPGDWKDADISAMDDGDRFDIAPNTRCFLYVRAEDQAGNVAEGWTRGIVVDNMLPNQSSGKELVVEPEGANEHGFFNQDVKVKISVKDSPEDDNCAALMSVNSSVGKDGTDTISDKELFSFTKELPTGEELTSASAFEMIQTIDARANESNEAYIEVTATDRSENRKTSTQILKIDVTKPVIEIGFDREDGANGRFYNQSRTATIHVHELNFDASAVEMAITRNGEPIELQLSDWTGDGSDHYAQVTFTQDGDYTMEVRCTDLADNVSETVQAAGFTIDCTAPQMAISLIPEADSRICSEGYYASGVTAQITVTEHNFNADDFMLDSKPASVHCTWKHEGDVHTARIPFEGDNAYWIRGAYTDMAGNAADGEGLTKEFVIDTTAPVLAITGVADGSANSGEVTPVITVLDLNLATDAVSIAVATGRGQMIENTVDTAVIDDGSGVGYCFTLSDMTDKADDIYYLTATVCDKAGNDASLTCRFSLNRNGSTYDFTDLTRLMENRYNTYIGMEDILITEMNIDQVDEFEVYISRNGSLGYKASYEKEVQGCADSGYTYTYRIRRENFAGEGSYRLSMYSKDRAGNEVNNSIAIHGKEVEFIIDNTAPKVVIDGVETGKVYDVEAQKIGIAVTDNFKLEEAEFTLVNKDNKILDSWNYMELSKEGSTLYITIPEYKEEVSLLYRVRDSAGNEVQTFRGESAALADFLVTTDKLVQFINKPTQTPFGRMILVLMGIGGMIVVCTITLLLHKRRNRGKFNR